MAETSVASVLHCEVLLKRGGKAQASAPGPERAHKGSVPQEHSHAPLSVGETQSSEVALRRQGTGGGSEHKWSMW